MKSTIILLLVAITTLALAGVASAEDTSKSNDVSTNCAEICKWAGSEKVKLVAGQHIDAGTVNAYVDRDNNNLVVEYKTKDGWKLHDTHLYVGTEPPAKHAPGLFPYKSGILSGVTSYTYVIPLSDIVSDCEVDRERKTIYLAAHADVKKQGAGSETAWGEGGLIHEKGPWAMYFALNLKCVCEPVPK